MAKIRLDEVSSTPPPPPIGAILLYAKTDDVVYVQDSDGNEVPIGTPDAITDLTGDVSASGPGSVPATVNSVGGKTALEIATSVNDTQAATAVNTPSTIVKRDGSGNFAASTVTLVNLISSGTTQSTDKDTGAIVTEGGLGVEKNINAGGDINAVGAVTGATFNGITVQAHASRHNPGGADALSTAIVVTQTPDQSNAEGVATSFARSDHVHNIPSGVPVQIGTANVQGAAASFALSDHVHNHGAQTSPTLHALATSLAHGFMSSTDKAKIDAELPASLGTANQVLGVNAGATAGEYKSLLGTANQITVTHGVGTVTFATPQDIATSSSPTFNALNLTTFLQLTQTSTPSTPAATKANIYLDVSQGFSRLHFLDETGTVNTILRDTIFIARNTTGSTITKGQAVYANGSDSPTSNTLTIALAKADSSNTVPALGLAMETIANGAYGRVLSIGNLSNFDTSAFVVGSRVYLSATTAGALTTTKPTSPNSIWQRIGIVLKSDATTGIIEVRPLATHGEESGTNTGFTLNTVALTDAATIATDASLGNTFTVTLTTNRTLGAPTNPTNGQKITYRFRQDGTGGRTLAFNAIFRFGLDIEALVLSTGANKVDYMGCIYNSTDSKWDVVAVAKGFN